MVLNIKEKQSVVAEIHNIALGALSAVVADPSNVTVNKITELRKLGRKLGVYVCVVRNTLMRRVVMDTAFECLKQIFFGSSIVAFSTEEPRDAALLFKRFAQDNITFKIKAAAFEGKLIVASEIDILATLPVYKEAIIQLILVMKEVAAGKLVRVLLKVCDQKKMSLVVL